MRKFMTIMLCMGTAALLVGAHAAGATHDAQPAKKRYTVSTVIRDCARDGKLNRRYSKRLLRRTLKRLPRDFDQYTDCRRVIRKAIRRHQRR